MLSYIHTAYIYIHIYTYNMAHAFVSSLHCKTRNEMNERTLNNRLEVNVLFTSCRGGQDCWSRKGTEGKSGMTLIAVETEKKGKKTLGGESFYPLRV